MVAYPGNMRALELTGRLRPDLLFAAVEHAGSLP
jgi:hypothetical protein